MIYMTTREWEEISKIIEEKDFNKLAEEIASRTYDLDISKQELDRIIKGYATKEEPKRLWKIHCYNPDVTARYVGYTIGPKDLTESEAVKWWNEYIPEDNMKKGDLYYKKEGEWIVYEENN